jgi:hypothetical protein
MAQTDVSSSSEPPLPQGSKSKGNLFRKLWPKQNGGPQPSGVSPEEDQRQDELGKTGLVGRMSRKVVPGLPRVQTFKRQQSEKRNNLAPVQPTPAERRAVSVDRRAQLSRTTSVTQSYPRTSAPDILDYEDHGLEQSVGSWPGSGPDAPAGDDEVAMGRVLSQDGPIQDDPYVPDAVSTADAQSMTTSQYDAMIHEDLEKTWILNLSMHFRDKSKREKFFLTYREEATLWRRVTISLDYREAPTNSLEYDLQQTKFQREKSAKIYEAIRESLQDIQFYDTVTNLKLQTTDGRLHVHVVEDVNVSSRLVWLGSSAHGH